MRCEAPAGFGGGEAEHEGREQPFEPGDELIWHSAVAQCGVDGVARASRAGGGGGPAQEHQERVRVLGCGLAEARGHRAQALVPGQVGVWDRQLREQPLHEPVEQVLLVANVVVERHRGDAESFGDGAHADRLKAALLGDLERGVEHPLAGDAGLTWHAGEATVRRIYTMYNNGRLRVLLSDGSGLTSRQVAILASAAGHVVNAVAPGRLSLAAFTRHVRRVHRVPAFGEDPWAWLEATLGVLRTEPHDVLLATQEQVALIARARARVEQLGVGLAVPPFESLVRVQDKVAQARTLAELGLPHPATRIVRSREQALKALDPPVYLKAPIGTASNSVHFASDHAALIRATAELDFGEGIVVQEPLDGPLAMVQSVFASGRLLAWHVNVREREGSAGGASIKRSITAPSVGEHVRALGEALRWHGALSLDAILTPAGPRYIDINPRLVEPGNAWRAGVDLVDALINTSLGRPTCPMAAGRPGVRTHQLLIAILGAAQHGTGRAGVIAEVGAALGRRGPYANSTEELTPAAGDPLTAVPVAAAALATLAHPPAWRWFAGSAVSAYALTPAAWSQIVGDPPALEGVAAARIAARD